MSSTLEVVEYPEGMTDAEVVAAECARFGIPETASVRSLLRHIINNNAAIYGMQNWMIEKQASDLAVEWQVNAIYGSGLDWLATELNSRRAQRALREGAAVYDAEKPA